MLETHPLTEMDPRWAKVLARDPQADGSFLFAVITTGIYCRPSCSARRAKPQNVRFYEDIAAAEAAGFRPCLRCHPKGQSAQGAMTDLIAQACRILETLDDVPKLQDLAAQLGVSPYHFHRQFKAALGMTPHAWATGQRAKRMRLALSDGETSVTQAIYEAGFGSSSRFYEKADALLGMTARRYKSGGAGGTIRFAVGQCDLGAILVAQSERGICAITLGDDPVALVQDLEARFPQATLQAGDAAFEDLVAQVVAFVDAPHKGLDLPLDIRGTAFQERVWAALRDIPVGETRSYLELAKHIGAPKSARAVALACGANRLAVAVPCHRIVRGDGSLSGYRWGVDRKRAILENEKKRTD